MAGGGYVQRRPGGRASTRSCGSPRPRTDSTSTAARSGAPTCRRSCSGPPRRRRV